MERVALLSDDEQVAGGALRLPRGPGVAASPNRTAGASTTSSPRSSARRIEKALRADGWNISRAAAHLGLPRNTLRYRMERHGLSDGRQACDAGASRCRLAAPSGDRRRRSGALAADTRHAARGARRGATPLAARSRAPLRTRQVAAKASDFGGRFIDLGASASSWPSDSTGRRCAAPCGARRAGHPARGRAQRPLAAPARSGSSCTRRSCSSAGSTTGSRSTRTRLAPPSTCSPILRLGGWRAAARLGRDQAVPRTAVPARTVRRPPGATRGASRDSRRARLRRPLLRAHGKWSCSKTSWRRRRRVAARPCCSSAIRASASHDCCEELPPPDDGPRQLAGGISRVVWPFAAVSPADRPAQARIAVRGGDSDAGHRRASSDRGPFGQRSSAAVPFLVPCSPSIRATRRWRRWTPKLRRAGMFDAVRQLLLASVGGRPRIVVLEDVHWMDQATGGVPGPGGREPRRRAGSCCA